MSASGKNGKRGIGVDLFRMKRVDFLIIGQGLAGTMLAFEMLKAGISFKIVSSPNKSKASIVAAGMVNSLVFKRLTKSWMVDDLLPVMKSTYQELEVLLNTQFYFEKKILKPLSEQEKELWIERKMNPEFTNYIADILDESPIEDLLSSAGYGLVQSAGYLKLSYFLEAAEIFFRERELIIDADFIPEELLNNTQIEIDGFSAGKIIFCEGYHLTQNSLFQFVKLNPVKGEVIQIYAPNLSEEYILNKKCFVLPLGNHRFKVGSTYDWKDLSEKTTEAGKASIVERLENLISVDYKIESHWAGVRPTVIDRRPVLGVHPEHKNIFVFNGLGTKGVMLAPYFVKEMLAFLGSAKHQLNKEIDVSRFLK